MKTMQELYNEVMASEEMKKEFLEAAKAKESAEAFLKKYGCDASVEDVDAFLKEKTEGELADDELESVAGGSKSAGDVIFSIFCSLGGYCAT